MPGTVTLDPRDLDPPAPAAQATVTLDPNELDKPAAPTRLSGPPASLDNPSQRLPSADEARSMADQGVMGTLKGLWQSATKPIPQTVHDLLGTGEKVQSMRDSGAAVGEAVRQGIDKFLGAGSASKIANDFPALGFAGNLADQGLQAAGGVLDFATSPAGVATLATPALPAAVQPAVGAGFSASMAPGAIDSAKEAIANPTSENVAKTVVNAGMTALPLAHPAAELASDALRKSPSEEAAPAGETVTLQPDEVKPAAAPEATTPSATVTLDPDTVEAVQQKPVTLEPSENPAKPPVSQKVVTLEPSEVERAPLTGDSAVAKTAAGTKIDTHYEVKPIADLVASHDSALNENPDYPQELQPRDRTRKASDQQINEIAGRLDPEELGASYKASDGAPIVGPDNVVESGNGRTIALMRLYEQDHPNGETYRQWIIDNAHKFGIDPVEASNVEDPVLVRVRDTPVDRAQFAREANGQTVQAMSASEQAAADSPRLSGELMKRFAPSDDGDVTTASNRDFVRGFMDQVASPAERNRYMTSEGDLSQEGVNRIRNAVFHKAYGDTSTIETMAESTDSNIRNITTGMLRAAPKFAQAAEGIDAGELHDVDFAPDVAAAAEKLAALREQGTSVDDYLRQGGLFGEDLTPEARSVLEVMNDYRRSPKKLGTFLSNLADQVEGLGNPKQERMLGDEAVPSKSELLSMALRQTETEYGETPGDLPAASSGTLLTEGQGARDSGGSPEGLSPESGAPGGGGVETEAADRGGAPEEQLQSRRGRGELAEEIGPHGPILRQFHHDAAGAIAELTRRQDGEAIGALHHPDVGDIDLLWGGEKHGLAKIAARHPEVLDDLQGIVSRMDDVGRTDNSIKLSGDGHDAVVRRNWKGDPKDWLLTAFRRTPEGEPSAGRTVDVPDARTMDRQAPPSGGKSSIPPRTTVGKAKAKNAAEQLALKGATVRNYFGDRDQVQDVQPNRLGGFDYTVKDLETGKVRTHSTPIAAKDVIERPGKVLGTGNSEAGALDISDLVRAIDDRFPGDVAKANYSGIGAAKDTFIRNLSQLEEASPEAHEAAVRAAASKSQVAVLLRSAVPTIEKALGPDLPWEKFRTALIESRLRGIRARWEDWARQASNKSVDGFRKGMQNGLMNILEQIEGQRGIPQDVRETALALLHNVDGKSLTDAEQMKLIDNAAGNNLTKVKQLQKFLSDTFSDAARGVAKVMEPEDFDATLNHPNFGAGLQAYKDLLEKPVAENHALNEGAFSTALGPTQTYYPLVPLEETQAPDISQGRPTPFKKPKNIANDLATGLAPAYDTSMSALEQRLSRAIKGNNKAAMFDSLEEAGLLKPLDVGERAGPFMEINGERYHAKTIELAEPTQRMVKGTLENVPAKFALVPDWLHKELEPIVKRNDIRISRPRQIVDAITQAALAGPSDFVFHTTNLLGTLVANTPFLGDSLGAKVAGNTPFTKAFTAVAKVVSTDPMSADASADLMEMAKAGVLPDKFGSVTYSRKFAEQTGADLKRASAAPILYGPKGLDVRARLVMWRLSKDLAPNDTVANRAKFVNQLGNYVTALQGPIERAMKSSVAPFYTAGSTMYRNGLNAVLGTGPVPGNKFEYRVAQQLSAGMVGTVATWAIAHKAMSGKWPWDDRKSKFMQLPVPDSVRRSPAGIAMFGRGRDTGYVNMSFFNPILTRGARSLGVKGAYDTRALGGNSEQMIESAIKDMGNSVIEPATTGPLVKAGTIMATGNEPYATSINPFRMMPATDSKKHGAAAIADRAKESALNMNSFFQNLGAATGLGHKSDEIATKGDRWLKMATSIALPRLLTQSDVGKQAAAVQRDRRRIQNDEARDR